MFKSIVFAIFCVSMMSAALPPRDVYSATIVNAENQPVDCRISYEDVDGSTLQSSKFTVTKDKPHVVAERIKSMGTWEAHSPIHTIQCGRLSLTAPFDGVTGPSTNWRFRVEKDKIVSVGSS